MHLSNFIGDEVDFEDIAYRCRKLIIRVALVSELNVLANQLTRIALTKRHTCDFTLNNLRDALTEVVANFPVYRTYVSPSDVSEDDAPLHRYRQLWRRSGEARREIPASSISSVKCSSPALPTAMMPHTAERLRLSP